MKHNLETQTALRRMVAVLAAERQALAGLDLEAVMACSLEKQGLCAGLEQVGASELDDECLSLLESAQQMNEVNRQIRNLSAANIASRIEAIRGSAALYSVKRA